jgi:hypothetical protein
MSPAVTSNMSGLRTGGVLICVLHVTLRWFFKTRRRKFRDKRLREAFINAFDFEWTNTTSCMVLISEPFHFSELRHDGTP